MGQGSMTGLVQLVAEELECDWSKVSTEFPTPGQNLARNLVWGRQFTGRKPRHPGVARVPSSWAERDDRDHAADNFFQGGSPKTGYPTSSPGAPSPPEIVLRQVSGDGAWMKI